MKVLLRGLIVPLLCGVTITVFQFAIDSWWLVPACAVSFFIGYADPYRASGDPK